MNSALAEKILQNLAALQICEIVFCPGGRNAPFLPAIQKINSLNPGTFKVFSFFEERCAAFFSLGRISESQKPVALFMTSGTAVAECLPAVIEAHYQGLPLLIVSADRPRSFRGSGAPQTIDQVHLFGKYVQSVQDIEHLDETLNLQQWDQSQPFHLNVCFSEPLLATSALEQQVSQAQPANIRVEISPHERKTFFHSLKKRAMKKPLVILGPYCENTEFIQTFLENFKAPIWCESLSMVRPSQNVLAAADLWVKKAFLDGKFHSVLKIGGTPTPRFWRDLDLDLKEVPVISVSHLEFKGLGRSVQHYTGYDHLKYFESDWASTEVQTLLNLDQSQRQKVVQILENYPLSESAQLAKLKKDFAFDFVFLGNSLPIREWDLDGSLSNHKKYWGLRGANGIDGQISSFIGALSAEKTSLGVFGDLTALYDLSGLWPSLNQVNCDKTTLVIVNNSGGQIFNNIFSGTTLGDSETENLKLMMTNNHQLNFSHWAKMWNWNYLYCEDISQLSKLPRRTVVELKPDDLQSKLFWQGYRKI